VLVLILLPSGELFEIVPHISKDQRPQLGFRTDLYQTNLRPFWLQRVISFLESDVFIKLFWQDCLEIMLASSVSSRRKVAINDG
jgi:hypothetical protein